MLRQHLVHEVQCAVSRSLGPQYRAAPFHALACEHALELVRQFLILSVQIAYLTGSYADVASRHILVRTDMAIQLCHKCLTELHHLVVALATDREVRSALAATHRQRGECVLESLFEAEELQNAQVYRRVESQSTLIRADGAVELHAVAQVHLYLALVVDPGHTEGNDALGFHDALHDLRLLELGVLVIHILDALQHLSDSL